MAKKKKRKKGGRVKKFVFAAVLLALVALFTYGYALARIVVVEYVDVKIKGLSPFLDGTTILFASDLKISSDSDAKRCAGLLRDLSASKPDIVLLGGDFTQKSFGDLFKSGTAQGEAEIENRLVSARRAFFDGIKDINAAGGVYLVSGDGDCRLSELSADAFRGNAAYIQNAQICTFVNGMPISIVGLSDYKTASAAGLYASLTSDDCVIALSHDPDTYALLSTPRDPRNGNALADLILAGHTLGGQIRVFGANLPAGYAGRFLSGVYNETGPNMLVSSGIGTDWLPFRVGSRAQVYVITLRKA